MQETIASVSLLSRSLAVSGVRRLDKGAGRTAIGLFERRGEMAVAGKAEIERQRRQIIRARQQIEGAGKAQAQVIAVERHAFDLLEHLGEIDG